MCKFIFGIIFSIFMMGIISCSGQDESTNLTIAIDMSGLLPSNESKDSFARSVDDEKWKLKVTLIDLEDENNIIPSISVPIIKTKASVTFEKVPLFFKGRIEAIIFEGETAIYTGRSEEFTVHEGRNQISVHLEKVDNPTEPGDPEDPADPNDPNQPGDGTGEGSGDTGGDEPTEPGNPEDPADPDDPNQPGDGTGDDSGETGGNEPTEPGNPTEPENPTEPDDPGDDPAIGETEKTANYTVKHYQQNIDDDGYTLVETDTEVKTGIVGAETSAEAKKYEGFEVYSVEQKTIAEDGTTEVQIKYNRKVITLTFDTKGGSSVESIIGRYGATVVAPENPTKNGYTFTAWNPTLPETFPSANSEYKATWTKEGDYTITYNLDGGTNANENPISYNVETETITLKEPTKIGYSFEGWYKGEEKITQITKGSTGNITLTAVWKANTDTVYTVEHWQQNAEDDGYTLYLTEEKNGTTGTQTTVTAKEYEGFEEGVVEQKTIAADGSTVVQIKYNRKVITLTFDTKGGSDVNAIEGKYGAKITDSIVTTKDGYIFEAWDDTLPDTFPATDTTFIAQWTPITYTVVFNPGVEDDSVRETMDSLPCTYDVPNELPENEFTRENFDFNGWKDAYGTEYKDCASVKNLASTQNAVVTLYAQWHPQSKVRDVDFSVGGGDVNYGTKVTLSCETKGATIYYKEGDAEVFSKYNGEIEIKNDVTITAYATKEGMVDADYITKTFTLKKYTVTLNYNNETEETTVEVTSGSQYTLPTEVTRTGYTFDGWDLDGKIVNTVTVTNANIELTATWTPITYEITYDLVANDVKNPNTVTKYTIESETIVLQSPTRTGYSFEGWKNTADEIVTQITKGSTGNVSLTAQWKKIEYELTITIPSYSDLNEFKITENNSTLSVEIPDGYTIEGWHVNGQEIDSPKNNEGNEITEGITSNQLGIEEGGIYTIMIIVKETNGTKLYSAECQLEVTK